MQPGHDAEWLPRRPDTLGFLIGDIVTSSRRRSRYGRISYFSYNDHTVVAHVSAIAEGCTYAFTEKVEFLEYVVLDQLAVEASRDG